MNDSDRRRSPDGFDDDAIFADIIAHLNDEEPEPEQPVRPTVPTVPTVPTAGDAPTYHWTIRQSPGEAGEPPASDATDKTAAQPQDEPEAAPSPQGWRAHEVEDDDEDEHFKPQPVTPLPVGDLQFWAILAGMIGGPLLLVYLVFFNRSLSSYWTLTAIAMSVGGFVLLVSRLPGNDGDEDDGARL